MGGNYFETSEYRIMDINLCGVDIHIPDGKTAINVSGGADSALILYILMKYSKHRVIAVTLGNSSVDNSNIGASTNVVNKVVELTDNYNVEQRITYMRDFVGTKAIDTSLVFDETIKVYYLGITSNPPDEVAITFNSESLGEEDRSPSVVRPLWLDDGAIYIPFYNIDKLKLAEIYDYLGITDTLFPLTVSCTKNSDGTHCDNCWWCSERKWAFGRLV
jgi:7-cyano-7-deazaguanine synthase in queuosine biosynthesis